jgi:hypothetical protein
LLVVGVAEQKRIKRFVGLATEENWSDTDCYGKHLQQQIINRIEKKFALEFVNIRFETLENQEITFAEVKEFRPRKGKIPAMLDGKTMFICIDARSEKIDDGKSAARLIAERTA